MVGLIVGRLSFRNNFRFEFILDILAFYFRFLILNLVIGLHRGAVVVMGGRYRFYAFHETSLEITLILLLVLSLLEL